MGEGLCRLVEWRLTFGVWCVLQALGTLSSIMAMVYLQRNGRLSFDESEKGTFSKPVTTVLLVLFYLIFTAFNITGFQAALLRMQQRITLWGGVQFIVSIFSALTVFDQFIHADDNVEYVMFLVDFVLLIAELVSITYAWNLRTRFAQQARAAQVAGIPVAQPANAVVYVDGVPMSSSPQPAYGGAPIDEESVPTAYPVGTTPPPPPSSVPPATTATTASTASPQPPPAPPSNSSEDLPDYDEFEFEPKR